MAAKYIIINNMYPVVFNEAIQHSDMARMCKEKGDVTSAGFVNIEIIDHKEFGYPLIRADAYGESISLRISSKPKEDTKILTKMFRGY